MFNNPVTRLLIAAVLALPIAYFLFIFMFNLINVKELNLDEKENRTLSAITPQQKDLEVQRSRRSKPKRIDSAAKPPPPPKLSTTKSQIDLPTPSIQGAAPQKLDLGRMQSLAIDPVAISDRDAQPIRPPAPSYPQRAQERGKEGTCDVRFDVDTRGRPYNISGDLFGQCFQARSRTLGEQGRIRTKNRARQTGRAPAMWSTRWSSNWRTRRPNC